MKDKGMMKMKFNVKTRIMMKEKISLIILNLVMVIITFSFVINGQEIGGSPVSAQQQLSIDEYKVLKLSLDAQLQSNNPDSGEINNIFEQIYNGERETTLFQQLDEKGLRKLWDFLNEDNKRNMFGLEEGRGLDDVDRMELWRELQYDSSGKSVSISELEKQRSEFLKVLTNEQKTEMMNLVLDSNRQIAKTSLPKNLVISKVEYKMGDRGVSNHERIILTTESGKKITIPLEDLPAGLKEYNVAKLIGKDEMVAIAVFGEGGNKNEVFLKNGEYISSTGFGSPSDVGNSFDINDENGNYLISGHFGNDKGYKIFHDKESGKFQIWGEGRDNNKGARLSLYDEKDKGNPDAPPIFDVFPNPKGPKTKSGEGYASVSIIHSDKKNGVYKVTGNYISYYHGFGAYVKVLDNGFIDHKGESGPGKILSVVRNGNTLNIQDKGIGKDVIFRVHKDFEESFKRDYGNQFVHYESRGWVPRYNAISQQSRPSPQIGQRQQPQQQPSQPQQQEQPSPITRINSGKGPGPMYGGREKSDLTFPLLRGLEEKLQSSDEDKATSGSKQSGTSEKKGVTYEKPGKQKPQKIITDIEFDPRNCPSCK